MTQSPQRYSASQVSEAFGLQLTVPPPLREQSKRGVAGLESPAPKFLASMAPTSGLNSDLMTPQLPPPPETPENIEMVRGMLALIPADCDRKTWTNVIWSLLATGWKCAPDLAVEWSRTAPGKFDQNDFDQVCADFRIDGGIGFGTLLHIAHQHGWKEPAKVVSSDFFRHYFVARIGGGVFVCDRRDNSILASAMSFSAFKQYHASKSKEVNQWLQWDERETYRALVFDPSGAVEPEVFNTWRGLAILPAPGECGRILAHLHEVWCGGNARQFEYVLCWLALLVQKPWIKPEVALVLRSPEGTGKTIIVNMLLEIFGTHAFTAAQKDQVAGRFNGHLFDKVLIALEEAFFAGDPAAVSTTKAFVTNPTIGYEAKGKDAFSAPNYAHVISLTNHAWAVPAGEDSRRWMVLDVSDAWKGDHPYFAELAAEIECGGIAAFAHHLMSIDLSGFNPRVLPDSNALKQQRVETMMRADPVAAWWMVALEHGGFDVEGQLTEWGHEIAAATLQRSYTASTSRARNAPHWDVAVKKLHVMLPGACLPKVRKSASDSRFYAYRLPDLEEAREHFQRVKGVELCLS